eukprot:m.43618 g.43618  ORF g.43618 m.43618 type:complete len:207 (+) comp14460_c0_seq1:135-755(+)
MDTATQLKLAVARRLLLSKKSTKTSRHVRVLLQAVQSLCALEGSNSSSSNSDSGDDSSKKSHKKSSQSKSCQQRTVALLDMAVSAVVLQIGKPARRRLADLARGVAEELHNLCFARLKRGLQLTEHVLADYIMAACQLVETWAHAALEAGLSPATVQATQDAASCTLLCPTTLARLFNAPEHSSTLHSVNATLTALLCPHEEQAAS